MDVSELNVAFKIALESNREFTCSNEHLLDATIKTLARLHFYSERTDRKAWEGVFKIAFEVLLHNIRFHVALFMGLSADVKLVDSSGEQFFSSLSSIFLLQL